MYSDERNEVLLWFIAAIAALNLNRILLSVKSAALKRNAADIAGTIIGGAAIICAILNTSTGNTMATKIQILQI